MKGLALGSCLCLASGLATFAQTPATGNPLGHHQEFGGIRTFLRAPYIPDLATVDADIVVIGVPFDEGTSGPSGTRFGPRDIREASLVYAWARPMGFFYIDGEKRVLSGAQWVDVGDINVQPMHPQVTFGRLTEAVRAIHQKGALPVVLGGDHSISFPAIRAFQLPSLTVIHFDAHLDSYGEPPRRDAIATAVTDHGGWVSAVAQIPGIRIVQIGM
ncbi:MAG: arginase family protein, partial [Candidatus Acidiferrales bacterium]